MRDSLTSDYSWLLSKFQTDGRYWFDSETNKKIDSVKNYRGAAVFDIGRLFLYREAVHLGYHEQGAQISDFYREYFKDWKIFEGRQRIRYLLVTVVIVVLVVVIFVSVFLRRRFARKSCQRWALFFRC